VRFQNRVALAGSERALVTAAEEVGPVASDQRTQVTVHLRRCAGRVAHAQGKALPRVSYSRFADQYGADSADIKLVEDFAHHAGLTIVESSRAKRRVVLSGTVDALAAAFEAKGVANYRSAGSSHTYRARTGELTIPTELEGVVIAVLGLDTRPVAKPHFRIKANQAATKSFTPLQLAELYNFPKGLTGKGQTIAIIELGGGYSTADLQKYFDQLSVRQPSVVAISVDGGQNSPGSDADGEVMLDIEVAGAVAPEADIAVYFAPNTDQGFIDAVANAAHDETRKPSVISISWGGPEDSWTQQSQTAMNAALQDAATLGVTVTVAAGDGGSSDGVGDGKLHVDFPAASPYALACGGTTLTANGTSIESETVWNETANSEGATGGGVSTVFALPAYQKSAKVPTQPQTKFKGRGVPDVAGNADPSTGYQVLVNGQNTVYGGTSAVAPLWAGLVALLNEQYGTSVGFLNPQLYPLTESTFRDISTGNNDDSGLGSYSARSGWDACTGLGSPNGAALLSALTPKSKKKKKGHAA